MIYTYEADTLVCKFVHERVMSLNGLSQGTLVEGLQYPLLKYMYNGILVPVRTSFGLRRCGGKTYNVST